MSKLRIKSSLLANGKGMAANIHCRNKTRARGDAPQYKKQLLKSSNFVTAGTWM